MQRRERNGDLRGHRDDAERHLRRRQQQHVIARAFHRLVGARLQQRDMQPEHEQIGRAHV